MTAEYNITIDGQYIGIVELTDQEAEELSKDQGVELDRA